jgi:hypothetical protein
MTKVYLTQEIPTDKETGKPKYNLLKDYTSDDYLLLSGDPATIGVICSVVSDMTNGKFKFLKWDRQEKTYYPIEIDLFKK